MTVLSRTFDRIALPLALGLLLAAPAAGEMLARGEPFGVVEVRVS